MLGREEARARLEEFRAAESRGVRGLLERARTVVSPSATLTAWVDRPAAGDEASLSAELDGLTGRELARRFTAIAPGIGEAVARWWVWARRAPYQHGWHRRGFRSAVEADSRPDRMWRLGHLLRTGREYPQDTAWFATWWVHLADLPGGTAFGGLFASEIDHGAADIAETLVDCLYRRHPIGGATVEGIAGLLGSGREDCWLPVIEALRNAGRQEGLRSSILEASDLAHPEVMARVLEVVVAEDLTRFASTIRAVDVWFGEELDLRATRHLPALMTLAAQWIRDPDAPPPTGYQELFVALWAMGLHDAHRASHTAAGLLGDDDPRRRWAAARLLSEIDLPDSLRALRRALVDPDERVSATALSAWSEHHRAAGGVTIDDDTYENLLARMRTIGTRRVVQTGVIGTLLQPWGRASIADALIANRHGHLPVEVLAAASPDGRTHAVLAFAEEPARHRSDLLHFVTDSSSTIRSFANKALATLPDVTADEARVYEESLRRKSSDVRKAAIARLAGQAPEAVAASVARLATGTVDQQRAAVELRGTASNITSPSLHIDLPPALRFSPADRTPAVRPSGHDARRFQPYHRECRLLVTSLRAWLAEHADVEVETRNGVELLSNLYFVPAPSGDSPVPLPELLLPWWDRIHGELTDGGVELALVTMGVPRRKTRWAARAATAVVGTIPHDDSDGFLLWQVLRRTAARQVRPTWIDVLLDAGETLWAPLPTDGLALDHAVAMARKQAVEPLWWAWRPDDDRDTFTSLLEIAPLTAFTAEQLGRLWRLTRFLDEPEGTFDVLRGPMVPAPDRDPRFLTSELPVSRPDQPLRRDRDAELLARAFDGGSARRGDVLEALIQPPWARNRQVIEAFTAATPPAWAHSGSLRAIVDEVRDAAVAGELARGELPSALSPTARALRSCRGIDGLLGAVAALGSRPFTRGYSWSGGRESALSHLVRIHLPRPEETQEDFDSAVRAAGLHDKRLVETAVYAPQWAGFVERHLQWPGFESAVWWVRAHTNDDSWAVDAQIREEWQSEVSRRTPLTPMELVRGAADVTWFRTMVDQLGEEHFAAVLDAGKYASSAGGHKRAELYARALLGQISETGLVERITQKRHQDSVRALGLLHVDGSADPRLLSRYELLRGFVATDRTSGSQRRASETAAVEIGLHNLARSAGYVDPQRLTWTMEAASVRDLANGPLTARDGDVSVALSLDEDGNPELTVRRRDRQLKTVPKANAGSPTITALRQRAAELQGQVLRMRRSLENACVTQERFTADELTVLLAHPVIAPMLRDLVLVSDEGLVGFATASPHVLRGPAGEDRPPDGSRVRIAHPADLLASGEWPDLQHTFFTGQRRQPFRQLFRELYLPTAAERTDGPSSRRYAGHQVERRRAGALFAARGWVTDFGTGFSRTYHAERITASVSVLDGFGTAAEVADTVIEDVAFCTVGTDWEPIPIDRVPAVLFSETMRDLDLVVSVAHSGGVDPDSSESSVEMRGRLVAETVGLLGLTNVEVTPHHARIAGTLGRYSVHLGSGQVHRIPGNAICIIPVGAQHRGRIFLPFVDDDPRTAEVLSKVLLLARDDRIQDPSILSQLA